jgi:1-acyl-sn-glycerol-3-phosphate acyltransferase
MILIRSLAFTFLFYVNFAMYVLMGLPTLLTKRRGVVQEFIRRWSWSSLRLLDIICGMKVEFRGLEHLPRGACIVAAKHQSFLETFALNTQMGDFTYVLKRELMGLPFFGWYLKAAQHIGIVRAKRGQALVDLTRQIRQVVADGRRVVIFPEGTRKPPGAPPDYKLGVAHLCAATQVTCVPVALNSGLFWSRRGILRRRGTVVIEFLEPIEPGLDKRKFMSILQSRIETATARLIADSIAADPSLRTVLADRLDAATPSTPTL